MPLTLATPEHVVGVDVLAELGRRVDLARPAMFSTSDTASTTMPIITFAAGSATSTTMMQVRSV